MCMWHRGFFFPHWFGVQLKEEVPSVKLPGLEADRPNTACPLTPASIAWNPVLREVNGEWMIARIKTKSTYISRI